MAESVSAVETIQQVGLLEERIGALVSFEKQVLIAIAGKQQIFYASQRSETEREAFYNLQSNVPSCRDTPLTEYECRSIGYNLVADGSCCELYIKAIKISSLADVPRPGVEIKTVPDELVYLEQLLATCRTRIKGYAALQDALLASPQTPPNDQPLGVGSRGGNDADFTCDNGTSRGSPKLPQYVEAAYQSYQLAAVSLEKILGHEPTDSDAYAWLKENGPSEYDNLPSFETWQKYVRNGRKHYGTQKHQRHNGQSSRSAIRRSETD